MNSTIFKGPVFILGNPRSGTSLLRLIISSHSRVIIPPECGLIIWLSPLYQNWRSDNSKNPKSIESFINDLFDCKKIETWNIRPADVRDQIRINQPSNYAELCEVVYKTYAYSLGKEVDIWGDKNNFHIDHLSDLHAIYNRARFIHIVRDGRDVACSYREVMSNASLSPYAPRLPTNIGDIARAWSDNIDKVERFVGQLPDKDAVMIRYEDLVLNQIKAIGDLCDWMDIPFEPRMIRFYEENKKKNLEPELMLDWKRRTLQPVSAETVGRYSQSLSSKECEIFLKLAGQTLEKFSYSQLT